MPRRDHNFGGFNDDLFGNRPSRRRRTGDSHPRMSRDEALRISQDLGLLEQPQPPPPIPSHSNADDGWEDVIDEPHVNLEIRPNSPGDQYATHQRFLRRAEAQERIRAKWKAHEAQMTAHFLHLQHSTCNWTKKDLANETWCQCPIEKLRHRQVDLIDLLSKPLFFSFVRSFPFCKSVLTIYQLLHLYLSISSSISINLFTYIYLFFYLYPSISSSVSSIDLFIYFYQSIPSFN